MTDRWLHSALKNDVLVAELLLQVKHSSDSVSDSDSDSLRAPPPPAPSTSVSTILPPRWGHRKYRSKSTAPTAAVTNKRKEHRGSPTTHLSWSGGSTSDGYDESSRPSDLSSGCRSVKSFVEHKDEETSLLNERIHINRESTSMRVTLNQQRARNENLKRIRIDLDQNQRNKTMRVMREHDRQMKFPSLVSQSVQRSCRVEAEAEAPQRGFVLPDLNMAPNEEDLAMMMS